MSRTIGKVPTTTPMLLVEAGSRDSLTVWNAGTQTVYIGDTASVTAAAGANAGNPIAANILAPYVLRGLAASNNAKWIVVASGTGDIRAFEEA